MSALCMVCGQFPRSIGGRVQIKIARLRLVLGPACYVCGLDMRFDLFEPLRNRHAAAPSVEHIITKKDGGCWHAANLALSHHYCNTARALYPSDQFVEGWARKVLPWME